MTRTPTTGFHEDSMGSSLTEFLDAEGVREKVEAVALKRILAFQLAEEMKRQAITKVEMARRMKTSRSQLDRLLDPDNDRIELATLGRAARALGRELRIGLV